MDRCLLYRGYHAVTKDKGDYPRPPGCKRHFGSQGPRLAGGQEYAVDATRPKERPCCRAGNGESTCCGDRHPGRGYAAATCRRAGQRTRNWAELCPKIRSKRDSTTGDATRVWRFPNPCGDWYLRKLSVGLWSRRLQVQILSGIFFISRVVLGRRAVHRGGLSRFSGQRKWDCPLTPPSRCRQIPYLFYPSKVPPPSGFFPRSPETAAFHSFVAARCNARHVG